jgi:hypothetical protein
VITGAVVLTDLTEKSSAQIVPAAMASASENPPSSNVKLPLAGRFQFRFAVPPPAT